MSATPSPVPYSVLVDNISLHGALPRLASSFYLTTRAADRAEVVALFDALIGSISPFSVVTS
jgi:hypothetical protein